MTLFRKKEKNRWYSLYYSLDKEIENARDRCETSFYYELEDREVDAARAYLLSKHRAALRLDHKTDGRKVYKVYGL